MRRSGKKILITVLMILGTLIIAGGVFAYMYFCTDMFRTGQELFAKYFMQNMSEIYQTVNSKEIIEIEEKLKESKYEEDITISYIEAGKAEATGQVNIRSQKDSINKKTYSALSLMVEGLKDSLDIEYMNENNMYSLRFTDAVKEFVTIENTNLKQLATNIGIDKEVVEKTIPNTIEFEKYSLENIKFTEYEKNTEINKYLQLIYDNISQEKYQKVKNTMITVNGKTLTTNAYKLTLNTEDIRNLEIKLLETLKKDEIILNKIEKIDEILKEYKLDAIKDSFIKSIEEKIELVSKEQLEENKNIVFTVYETSKKTVRIKMEQDHNNITLDTTETNGKYQINVDLTNTDEENMQSSTKVTLIKENDNKISIQLNSLNGEEQYNLSSNLELIENENNIQIDFVIDDEDNQIKFTRNINFVDEINYTVTLDNKNNIILNEQSSNRLSYIFNILGARLKTEYVEPLKEKISVIQDKVLKDDNIENPDFSKPEILLFNQKFEDCEGNNIPTSEVNGILNTVISHNKLQAVEETEQYVIVSGDIIVKEHDTTELKLEGNDEYKVECKHSEYGFINEIVITKNAI